MAGRLSRGWRRLGIVRASGALLGFVCACSEPSDVLLKADPIVFVTTTPITDTGKPRFEIACKAAETRADIRLINDDGAVIYSRAKTTLRHLKNGNCQTVTVGETIVPKLKRNCEKDDPADDSAPICVLPPTERGLKLGVYRAEVQAYRSGGAKRPGEFTFKIAPKYRANFAADPAPPWVAARGRWTQGLSGVHTSGASGGRPFYYYSSTDRLSYSKVKTIESRFVLNCFSADCGAGHTITLGKVYVVAPVRDGDVAAADTWESIHAVVTGDEKLRIQVLQEQAGGQAVRLMKPIDVSKQLNGDSVVRLSTDVMVGDDYLRAAIHVNGRAVACKYMKIKKYDSDLSYSGVIFNSKDPSDSVEFQSYRVIPSRWDWTSCRYKVLKGF